MSNIGKGQGSKLLLACLGETTEDRRVTPRVTHLIYILMKKGKEWGQSNIVELGETQPMPSTLV